MNIKYNLREILSLDSMHDQRVDMISYIDGKIVLSYENLHFSEYTNKENKNYYIEHVQYQKCDVVFTDVDVAFATIISRNEVNIIGKEYEFNDFIEYINMKKLTIETIQFLIGYEMVLIRGTLVNELGKYCDDCEISIIANKVEYVWE